MLNKASVATVIFISHRLSTTKDADCVIYQQHHFIKILKSILTKVYIYCIYIYIQYIYTNIEDLEGFMLKIEHLDKKLSYGKGTFRLQDISLHLPKGLICGLIGENGAGKTSFIKLLIGLYRLEQGNIYVNELSLTEKEAEVKDMLGLVLSECYFEQNMTLEQIGIFYGELYSKFDRNQYLKNLMIFGMDKKQKLKQLSVGMKIKVQLAFALSHDAKLFVFDEPTAGLDREFREEFLNICTNLVSDGEKSILISSHITEDLDRIADYIGYIQKGRMLFFDTKENLCDSFWIVKGEDYKCKLIPKKEVVSMEEGKYSTSAMVFARRRAHIDNGLEKYRPNIREFMYYLEKGGEENAKAVAEKYMEING